MKALAITAILLLPLFAPLSYGKDKLNALYFRGTPNSWNTTPMDEISEGLWSVSANFKDDINGKFKFDLHGDGSQNYGDNHDPDKHNIVDYIADQDGEEIKINKAGDYTILFAEKDNKYHLWSGEYTPFIGPYLTFGEIEKRSLTYWVHFETIHPAKGSIKVWRSDKKESEGIIYHAQSTSLIHHIKIPSLEKNKSYKYRVFSPIQGELSQTFEMNVGSEDDGVRFVLAGDMQDNNGGQKWLEVARQIEQQGSLDFIASVGDLVSNSTRHEWKLFFEKGRNLLSRYPILPVVGNHDTKHSDSPLLIELFCVADDWGSNPFPDGSAIFRNYFPIDPSRKNIGDGTYYRFDFGSARFLVLNSEVLLFQTLNKSDLCPKVYTYFSFERDGNEMANKLHDQWLWFNKQLNEIPIHPSSQRWSFVLSHAPPYNAMQGHYEEQDQARDRIASRLNGKIDWSFTGHVHAYQRFKPIFTKKDNTPIQMPRYGTNEGEGVGYLIAPPAGNYPRGYDRGPDYGNLLNYPQKDGATSKHGFVIIDILNNKMTLKPVDVDGNPIEEPIHYSK